MKGTLSLQRLKRAAAVAGVGALVLGGVLLGTTQAHAAVAKVGTGTGLTLTPASGVAGSATTAQPTFQSTACPANDQASATVNVLDPTFPAGTPISQLPAVQEGGVTAPASAAFGGSFSSTLHALLGDGIDITAGVQFEVAVECFTDSAASQGGVYVNSTFVTINADGSWTANQSFVGAPQSVNLIVSASPNPATSGQTVTVTATASVPNATGTVQFTNNGSAINSTPVSLSGATTSTASTSFTAATVSSAQTYALTAVYTPASGFTAGTVTPTTLTVNPAPVNPVSATGTIPLAVTVPLSGTFTLTVQSTTWVPLTVNSAGTTGTAATTPIVVVDTYNSYPGWSVTGEATSWHGVTNPTAETPSGYPAGTNPDIPTDHGQQSIPADQLGWHPTDTGTVPSGVQLGGDVTAGTGHLGDAFQTLASAAPGVNSFTGAGGVTLGANLTLAIPAGQEEGPYAADLNIDAMSGTP